MEPRRVPERMVTPVPAVPLTTILAVLAAIETEVNVRNRGASDGDGPATTTRKGW